jgi:rhodanese-related sulfurtransferase
VIRSAADDIDVAPAEVRRRHAVGDIQLVDVREPYERDAGHIEGSRHVELAQLAAEAPTIHQGRPVVFYCRVGARSRMAAGAFRRAGYPAYSMAGGLLAWHAQGHPLAPEGGVVADH